MSRRRAAEKRKILPDAKYGDLVLAKFINCLMQQGKRSTAEKIVYAALETLASRAGGDAVKSFHDALDNVKPSVEVRSRRVGGATYQVPVEVRNDRRQALAIRWVIETARARSALTSNVTVAPPSSRRPLCRRRLRRRRSRRMMVRWQT